MATHSTMLAWRIPGMGTWWAAVYGVAQSWTRLSDFTSLYLKAMATHSSTLAWEIPWMEEPGRLQSMGSRSRRRTRLSNFTFTQ